MTMAIRIHQHGGPEAMRWEEVAVGDPGEGEVRIRHHAVGLNYIDVYHRTGLYPVPGLPTVLGLEASGEVVATGPGVEGLKVGSRVAYASPPIGAYCEERLMPAGRVVELPDAIDHEQAAAMMLQGMTVQYLIRRTHEVKPGETILVHAAAGGVGLILCQWAKHLGATVIGTVGSDEKAELAMAHGCDHAILYQRDDVASRVRDLTDGEGVAVVYDSVGKDTLVASMDSLRRLGMLVSFGNSSGPVESVSPGELAKRGSLIFTRPSLMDYTAARDDLVRGAEELFEVVGTGAVKIEINQRYSLADAATAHRDLEARKTTGSTIFTVG